MILIQQFTIIHNVIITRNPLFKRGHTFILDVLLKFSRITYKFHHNNKIAMRIHIETGIINNKDTDSKALLGVSVVVA